MDRTEETNSLEVRWFATGSLPRALGEWIGGLGSVDASTRTDPYLSPLSPALNVKLRDGESVEIKRRLGAPERRGFGSGVTGSVEQWYKWSFALEDAPGLRTADRTGLWLPVEKTRALYAFEDAEIRSLVGDPVDHATAGVEVTEVSARSETAWTCCLEVSGQVDELEGVFTAVGSELFGAGFPVELRPAESFGYAEWLQGLTADADPDPGVLIPSNR